MECEHEVIKESFDEKVEVYFNYCVECLEEFSGAEVADLVTKGSEYTPLP